VSSTFTERINFIQKHFGKGVISRDGNDITISCPTCGSASKKKLAINLETWKYHCWVCSARGNSLVSLLKKNSNVDVLNFYRTHFLNSKILISDAIQNLDDKIELPDNFKPIVTLTGKLTPDQRAIVNYLTRRGLTERDLWRYRVGVSNESRFSRRAIFASLDTDGEVNYFISRSVDSKSGLRYLNSSADKTGMIFNEADIDWDKPLFLVEGIFDLISLKENGTCLLGSTLSESSLLFKKIVANECDVILCLDNDMVKKTGKIADLLMSYGSNVSIMDTSCAKDLGEMSDEQIQQSKSNIVEWNPRMSFFNKLTNIKSGSII
jgi:DNA primase